MDTITEAPGIGHNEAPEPTPFELSKQEIEDLCYEAKHWLDGEPISRQEVADQVDFLKASIRDAKKLAKERQDAETKQLNDELKAIYAKYNALIGDTKASGKGIAVVALDACDQVLEPWLRRIADEKAAAERAAREEAEVKARAAQEAIRAAREKDLAAKEEAEALLRDAKKAEAVANKIARSSTGMTSHLRRTYRPVMVDATAAAKWAWAHHRAEMEEFLKTLAAQAVRAGNHSIPGFEVIEEGKVA